MAAFVRRYRDRLAMPLLASSCALAFWATSAGADTLPRERGRAEAATWFAAPSSPHTPPVSGVFRASLSNRYGVAAITLQASEDAANPRIARLETAWTTALPGERETLRLGDSLDQAGTWGPPVRFGGLQYGTDLDRGAGFVAPPAWPRAGFIAASANWPHALPGFADGERSVMQPSRTAFALAPAGRVDHACAVGFLRSNYGLDGDRYGPPFASATLRRGISEDITAELRGGAQEGVGNGGIAFTARLKGLGVLSAATAASRGDPGTGRLAQTGFEYRRAGFSASIRSQWASSEFRQLGVPDEGVPPRHWSVARAIYDAAHHGVFGIGYAALARYDEGLSEAAEASYRVGIGRVSTLALSVSRTFAPEPGTSLMLVLTLPLDHRTRARAAATRAANGMWGVGITEPASLAHAPSDEGLGWTNDGAGLALAQPRGRRQ